MNKVRYIRMYIFREIRSCKKENHLLDQQLLIIYWTRRCRETSRKEIILKHLQGRDNVLFRFLALVLGTKKAIILGQVSQTQGLRQ